MPQEQSSIRDKSKTDIRKPKRYTVYIHNDDFTTMDFVVMVLITVFHKTEPDALALMLQVHHSDKAPVGTYSYDIAMTKVSKARDMAHEEGFPLRLSIVEA